MTGSRDAKRSLPATDAEERAGFEAAWEDFTTAMRRARSRAADRPGARLSIAQYHLLSALQGGAGMSVGELARAAGVSSPTATRMLDALERDGIVRRSPEAEDRRRISICTTDEGRRAVAAARRRLAATRERLYAELTPEERELAAPLLRRLAEVVERL